MRVGGNAGNAALQAEVAEAAGRWLSHLAVNDGDIPLYDKNKTMVAEELPKLVASINKFASGALIAKVRKVRDAYLAHASDVQVGSLTYQDIEGALSAIGELIAQASLLIDGKSWKPSQFQRVQVKYANDFWDAVEAGLLARRS